MTIPTVFNPTVYLITNISDSRIPIVTRPEIVQAIHRKGYVYASYYRPRRDFFEHHVFVCPHCTWAASINEGICPEHYHCERCDTNWKTAEGKMLMQQSLIDMKEFDRNQLIVWGEPQWT